MLPVSDLSVAVTVSAEPANNRLRPVAARSGLNHSLAVAVHMPHRACLASLAAEELWRVTSLLCSVWEAQLFSLSPWILAASCYMLQYRLAFPDPSHWNIRRRASAAESPGALRWRRPWPRRAPGAAAGQRGLQRRGAIQLNSELGAFPEILPGPLAAAGRREDSSGWPGR